MSVGILLAVLGAALLHATWNAMIKLETSKVGAMVILSVAVADGVPGRADGPSMPPVSRQSGGRDAAAEGRRGACPITAMSRR
jgi:hypothetical protein